MGQIPNNLALRLDAQNVNILGTSAKSIDNAEDRDKFSAMLDRIGVDQPEWSALTSMEDIHAFIDKVGFPVLVRPSYVLSGAAMNVCSNQEELERFLKLAANVSKKHPVVVSQFIEHAKEVEMDAVAQNGEIVAYAISEHIEYLKLCIRGCYYPVPTAKTVCGNGTPHQAHLPSDSQGIEYLRSVQYTISGKG